MGSGSRLNQAQNNPLRIMATQKHDTILLEVERRNSDDDLMSCRGLGLTFDAENGEDPGLGMEEMPRQPGRVMIRREDGFIW